MFATHMKKKNWFADTAAYLIFDDTVINKKYGHAYSDYTTTI
jgi:hypothetical protein